MFWLFELGEKKELDCSNVPVTTAVIESHGAIQTIAGLIYISNMRPGNHTQFDRIVLIVDGLSSQEISLLKGLDKYAYVQSGALAARRQRNDSSRVDPPNVKIAQPSK